MMNIFDFVKIFFDWCSWNFVCRRCENKIQYSSCLLDSDSKSLINCYFLTKRLVSTRISDGISDDKLSGGMYNKYISNHRMESSVVGVLCEKSYVCMSCFEKIN